MFERADIKQLRKRIREPRQFLQVIMGPRQVGKTTLVQQLISNLSIPSQYVSADAEPAAGSTWLEQVWGTARLKLQRENPGSFLLVIDEIQKISNWSETVKKLWDEDSFLQHKLKVIILGSSRLLLQQGLTESLAGRFELVYLPHWSLSEMEEAFGWDPLTYAWFGGYPGGAGIIGEEGRWKSYIRESLIEASISRDILMLTRIDKPALMKNLFEIGCTYSGQILSLTKIQGQLQDAGNTTTLAHYLHLLSTAGLLTGIQKFSVAEIRQRASSPKFQVHNNALLSARSERVYDEVIHQPAQWGRVVESAIGAYLVNESLRSSFKLYYWRERNEEVDFVLQYGQKQIAIEVKSGFMAGKSKGMETFRRNFNPHKMYRIDNQQLKWEEFLRTDPLELF